MGERVMEERAMGRPGIRRRPDASGEGRGLGRGLGEGRGFGDRGETKSFFDAASNTLYFYVDDQKSQEGIGEGLGEAGIATEENELVEACKTGFITLFFHLDGLVTYFSFTQTWSA